MDFRASARAPAPRAVTRARPWALGLALACALVGALAVSGCGLFTPATPQPPGGGTVVTLPNLTTVPDSALYSLILGMVTKNSQYYEHAIAETTINTPDFHAVFDPQDTLEYSQGTGARPPQDWTSQNERTFFSYFVSKYPVSYTVYFLPDNARPDVPGPQETILYRHYRVFAATAPVAVGLVDLTLRRVGVNGEWKITYWVDRRDTSATGVRTCGRLRLDSLTP